MNEPLRRALFQAGLGEESVAGLLGVDPKTVRRWLDGRLPYPRLRMQLAKLLGADETELWPELMAARADSVRPAEVVAIYGRRWALPRDAWLRFFGSASREIAILGYSSLFLAEDIGIVRLLRDKAASGVRVRIALGDPDCSEVAERERQEAIDAAVAAKIRNSLALFKELRKEPNTEFKLHQTVLYNSIYLSDNELLVNQYAYGIAAANSPVLHLKDATTSELASGYLASFERIWASAVSIGRDA